MPETPQIDKAQIKSKECCAGYQPNHHQRELRVCHRYLEKDNTGYKRGERLDGVFDYFVDAAGWLRKSRRDAGNCGKQQG